MRTETIRGRGAALNPRNRFERVEYVPEGEARDPDDPGPLTQILRDATRTIIAKNDSPDVGFQSSINPYRGCEHGCALQLPRFSIVLGQNGLRRLDLRLGQRLREAVNGDSSELEPAA